MDSFVTNHSGNRIYYDAADMRGQHLAKAHGNLNQLSLELWNKALALRSWDLVVDVGCNYGEMVVGAELPDPAQLIAFEPNTRVLPYLKQTLAAIGRRVELREKAIADSAAKAVTFIVDDVWSGTSSLPSNTDQLVFGHDHKHSDILVEVSTLDHELAAYMQQSICIKIDVEGHELAVLEGAKQLLSSSPHWTILLEILHMPLEDLADLARRHPLYLLNKQSSALVRVYGDNMANLQLLLNRGLLYSQDAIIVNAPLLLKNGVAISDTHLHTNSVLSAKRRVVYTALLGNYEQLNEQALASSSEIDFICFTDNPLLLSETWTIRLIQPRFARDAIRSARYIKILGPELLKEYDESLWIDNTVQLRVAPEHLLQDWLSDTDFALPLHSFRETVAGEFDAVNDAGLDDPSRIYEQLFSYAAADEHQLQEKPYWTALLARRHTYDVQETMRRWYDHVLRYSRRDQLSINHVLSITKLQVNGIEIDNLESIMHQWPVHRNRQEKVRTGKLSHTLRIPLMELGRLENSIQGLQRTITAHENRVQILDARNLELQAKLSEQTQSAHSLFETLVNLEIAKNELHQHFEDQLQALRQIIEQLNASTSWRITAPFRTIATALPSSLKRWLRRTAKTTWWLVTPHKWQERITFLRNRHKNKNQFKL